MKMFELSQAEIDFGAIVHTRLALCYAAINKMPSQVDMLWGLLNVGPHLTSDIEVRDPRPSQVSWNLWVFTPDEKCPIQRIQMPGWFIDGICRVSRNPEFPMETIDPEAVTSRVRDVVNASVGETFLPYVLELVDCMEESAAKFKTDHPEALNDMRQALRIKGMAIVDHLATGEHQEYDHYARQILS